MTVFSFRNWLSWLRFLKSDFKVFIYFVILFPIINLLWNTSVPGLGLSFTALFSAFFVLFFLIFLLNDKKHNFKSLSTDKLFKIFFSLIILKSFYLLVFHFNIKTLEQVLMDCFFLIIFSVLSRIIKSDLDFIMVAKSYIYSGYIIIFNFLFGVFEGNARTSRGLIRETFGYYDVTNVSVQCVFTLVFIFFLIIYFREKKINISRNDYLELSTLFIANLLIIQRTYHILSYVNVGILLIFIFSSLQKIKFMFPFILIAIGLITINSVDVITYFYKIIIMDINRFLAGEIVTYGLHGRIGYWIEYFDEASNLNFLQLLTGYYKSRWASGFVHNDFLRISASIGLIGLFVYCLIWIKLFFIMIRSNFSYVRLVGLAIFFITMFYSITIAITSYTFACLPICSFLVFVLKFNKSNLALKN